MSRKTHKVFFAAIAAALTVTLADADIGGANAQGAEITPQIVLPDDELTTERVPVFVSEEVVQDVPTDEERAASDAPAATSLYALVDTMRAQRDLSPEMECLAGAVYFESRGEPLAGQLAVARVIVNRSEHRAFPSSYCGVVFQRAQFSFVRNGRMPAIKRSSAAWHRAKAIARIAHENLWDSEARDSLYFHADYVQPSWSRTKTARATIDTHIFYR